MIKYFLSQPSFDNTEKKIVLKALKKTWVSTAGPQVKIFENKLSSYLNTNYAVATNSGTSALHLALLASSVSKNEEVIVPSLTFVATINAIKYVGANPIFFDSDDYFNIKIDDVIKFLDNNCYTKNSYTFNKKTKKRIKAIILVHVWGNAVNINKSQIKYIKSKGLKIIEDSTESLGTKYINNSLKNKFTGTIGDFGCFSFNGNKILSTGSGGAVVTKNKRDYQRINYLATQAKDDSNFFIHNEVGFNYKMSNISASIGIAQLTKIKKILIKKNIIYKIYTDLFKKSLKNSLMKVPDFAINNNWMNIMIFPKKISYQDKKIFIHYMEKNKIQVRPVWTLNHLQKNFKNFQSFQIYNSLDLYHRSFCIPSDVNLSEKDIKFIYNIINE